MAPLTGELPLLDVTRALPRDVPVGIEVLPAQKLVAEANGFNVRFRDWIYRCVLDFAWRGRVRLH